MDENLDEQSALLGHQIVSLLIIDHGTLTARSALCIKIEVQIRNIKTKFLLYKETFNFLLNTTHLTSATP